MKKEIINMGIALSTAGIRVEFATETISGTRPTTGYKNIPDPIDLPDVNPEPESLQSTSLNETEFHTYIDGLKDVGGNLAITFNINDEFDETWQEIVDEYETAAAANMMMWFSFVHPKMKRAFYFAGKPVPLSFGAAAVSEVFQAPVYVAPLKIEGMATKHTS